MPPSTWGAPTRPLSLSSKPVFNLEGCRRTRCQSDEKGPAARRRPRAAREAYSLYVPLGGGLRPPSETSPQDAVRAAGRPRAGPRAFRGASNPRLRRQSRRSKVEHLHVQARPTDRKSHSTALTVPLRARASPAQPTPGGGFGGGRRGPLRRNEADGPFSAAGPLLPLHRRLGRLIAAPEPADRPAHFPRCRHGELHPAARGHPTMGHDRRGLERALLLVGGEPDPQVRILGPEREAGEESRPDEVAPAPEHGRDPDAGPAPEHPVQLGRGAGPAALQA